MRTTTSALRRLSLATLIAGLPWAVPLSSVAATPATAGAAQGSAGIAWVQGSTEAEVDAAFARAQAERKPLFLYWGAKWCPPCNQVQATLFNRADFVARSRAFVPVYIDGDSPGAQKLGTRFKVRGYPTMVLFASDGRELTRLPGEVDAVQYTEVLTLGMNAQRPLKAVLADARTGAGKLSPADWRMLAFYSWDTDEQQLVPKDQVPALLKQLAERIPAAQADTADRLLLQALAAAGNDKSPPVADAASRDRVLKLLADPTRSRAQMDVLSNRAPDLARALTAAGSAERSALKTRFDTTLRALARDSSLSRADRLTAQLARVQLLRLDVPKGQTVALPDTLLAEVRDQVARDDREISNGYERQAVITTGAYVLGQAGLMDASDALLKANLAKSHSPYYLMSALASNARQRGDTADALRWYEEAHKKSVGPATRLQWGASHVTALVELAPQDTARIERAAQQVFADAAAQPNAFYERSARSLQRVGAKLSGWASAAPAGSPASATLQRLQQQLDGICQALPAGDPQRAVCDGLLKPAADGKAA